MFFTPPYHSELQTIEKAWAVAKNHVATQKHKGTMKQLKTNLKAGFATVTSKTWAGIYRAVQRVENEFVARQQQLELLEEETIESEEEDEDEDEHPVEFSF